MKKSVSNAMLVLICAMIILYTIANFVLQYFVQVEVSPTLTTAWFAFWGTELVALAAIKTCKVKHNYKKEEEKLVEPEPQVQVEPQVSTPMCDSEVHNPENAEYYSVDVEALK